MLRICKTIVARSFLQPRILVVSPPAAGASGAKTIEEKLGLPPKPKKPSTPYLKFMSKIRPVLSQKHPDAKMPDLAKLGGEHWARADPELKTRLEEEFRAELASYHQEIIKYESALTDDQKEQILKLKNEIEANKTKRKTRKKVRELGKPKRPCSAFMTYLQQYTKKENEEYKVFLSRIAKQWQEEDQKVKDRFMGDYHKLAEGYRRELQNWEEKMIRLGNIELVRNEVLIEPVEPVKNVQRAKKPK